MRIEIAKISIIFLVYSGKNNQYLALKISIYYMRKNICVKNYPFFKNEIFRTMNFLTYNSPCYSFMVKQRSDQLIAAWKNLSFFKETRDWKIFKMTNFRLSTFIISIFYASDIKKAYSKSWQKLICECVSH